MWYNSILPTAAFLQFLSGDPVTPNTRYFSKAWSLFGVLVRSLGRDAGQSCLAFQIQNDSKERKKEEDAANSEDEIHSEMSW